MAPNKRSTFYKGYIDAAKGGRTKVTVPDTTWRRWLKQGKITPEQLKEMGITPYVRKRRILNICGENEAAGEDHVPVPQDEQCAERMCTSSCSASVDGSLDDSCSDSQSTTDSDCDSLSSFSSSGSSSESESYSDDSDSSSDGEVPTNIGLFKILNSKFIGPDVLNQPLHPSLSVSKFEVLLMILHLSMRHRMTDVFLEHLLEFVDEIVGTKNSLGISKHLFKKLFQFGRKPTMHYFCPLCNLNLGTDSTCNSEFIECRNENCEWKATSSSHNNGHFFLTLGIRDQLHDVLCKPDLKFVSKERLDRVMSDMMDGKEYRSQSRPGRILSNKDALTLTINTDSSPVFKSGPNCLWPVYFYINEIEPSKRFSSDNIMLAGLWFGKSDPNMKMFFEPMVKELKELEKSGIVWRKPCGTVIESPVYVICCCADSVARPKIQNHKQCNGSFACTICLHPNTNIEYLKKVTNVVHKKKSKKNKKKGKNHSAASGSTQSDKEGGQDVDTYKVTNIQRYVRGEYFMRTDKTLREHMKLASVCPQEDIYGSTGTSVLFDLKHFNMVHGFAIDYMHALLLGTTKRLANLLFDSTSHAEDYYIGRSIDRVDSRLKSVTLPSGFRPPRPISDRVHWKANEWRAFLLYFGLPALINILPQDYYNHFKRLVVAVYTLCKESILHDEVKSAHELLEDFVWEYQDLYGKENMVFNVHVTGHMADLVAHMGPLWAFSAFPFEGANGRMVKLAMGTKGVVTQITRKFLMTKSVSKLLLNKYTARENILKFCCGTIGYKYLQNSTRGRNNETLLGKLFYYEVSDVQKQACIDKALSITSLVSVVNRVVVRGTLYHARLTTRQVKACDSCVRLISGEYALIDLILVCNRKDDGTADPYFLITKLNIAIDPSPLLVSHIKQCSLDSFGDVELITSADISRKCLFYTCSDKNFVGEIANFFETD